MPDIITKYSSNLHYEKTGNGPAIMLIHGFPANGGTLWNKIIGLLSQSFTVLIPDLPGSGKSKLDKPTDLAEIAICLKEILVNERIEQINIVGHSMGGYIAFSFAEKYPANVAGITLVHSTPVADDEDRILIRKKAIELIKNGGKNLFLRQLMLNLFSNEFKRKQINIVEKEIESSLKLTDNALINFYYAMINRKDYSQWLKKVLFPMQWICGIEDNVIIYKNLLQHCIQSEINFVTFYPECGHMSMIEQPEQLATDIKMFAEYCCLYLNS